MILNIDVVPFQFSSGWCASGSGSGCFHIFSDEKWCDEHVLCSSCVDHLKTKEQLYMCFQDCRWWGCYTNPSTCLMTTTSLVAISRLAVLEAPSLRPHFNPSFCENFTPSLASGSGNYCCVLN